MYLGYVWFTTISKSVLATHIFQQGLTLDQMMLGQAIQFASQLALLLLVKKYAAKKSWTCAIIAAAISIVLVINIHSLLQYYLAVSFGGLALGLFFVMYNIAHFNNTPKAKTGHSSGIMFAIHPAISVVAPLLAGAVATHSFNLLWLISLLSFLVALYTVSKQANFRISYKLKTALNELRPTRIYIFLEGIWEAVIISVIPIYTLKFISTPLDYGKYIAYLSVAGLIANIILGKLTDKLQKRSVFIYPTTIALATLTTALSFSLSNLYSWIVITGLIQFLIPIFWNITTSLVVDQRPNLEVAIPGREILLAVGRMLGLGITYLGFRYNYIQSTFAVLTIALLLIPTALYWNSHMKKKYTYL